MIPLYKNSELTGEAREKFFLRSQADIEALSPTVKPWIEKVKSKGDQALLEYIQKFDNRDFTLDQLRVSPDDIKKAYQDVNPQTLKIMKRQIEISRNFHEEQARRIFQESQWEIEYVPGVRTGSKKTPIEAVGLYVPAGKAPLPTVSQILTVAAKAAEVPRIAVFFPPTNYYPEIIVAADLAGADEIYRVGGIAAIAAMAYGTETIEPVNKISGPGSPYVQAAKKEVFGQVGVDMIAGPSEGLGMVDQTANPAWVAADILARCEHGPDSCYPILTNDSDMVERILFQLEEQLPKCSRADQFIRPALNNGYNGIILVDSREEMIDVANAYGAEHLQISMENAEEVANQITNAGSIFIGNLTTVPLGDYASGTNHSLPTSRAVKFSSPVSVETFLKTNEYQIVDEEGLKNLEPIVSTIADVEGLDAHARAVTIRL